MVVSDRMSPLAFFTMVVMDPSLLNTWLVVVEEEEDEEPLLPEVEELDEELVEEDVPNRLLTALLPLRLEMEEDIE